MFDDDALSWDNKVGGGATRMLIGGVSSSGVRLVVVGTGVMVG